MKKLVTILFVAPSLFVLAQTGSEIYLYDMKTRNGKIVLTHPKNISSHKGYDNQPFFHPNDPLIYYSSFDDSGRSEIKCYNYQDGRTNQLSFTREREYSPTVVPGNQFISCIIQRDNGAQDLGKIPITGGTAAVLINNLKIGYHAWAGADRLLLFVLGDSNTSTLHLYHLGTKSDTILAGNIGRSLHRIPGQDAMSFVQRVSDKKAMIQRLDLQDLSVRTITESVNGLDHLTWLQNNVLLMSDGTHLFSFRVGKDMTWTPIEVKGETLMMKGVSRLSTNIKNTKLAVVVSE